MPTPEDIAEELRVGIRELRLPPGRVLVQDELSKQLGISRNPVREALRILAGEGLVIMGRGERATVRSLSLADLAEIYALRLALEPALAGPVIEGARRSDVARLRALAADMAGAPAGLEEWLRLNFAFHTSLYAMADRPHTARILTNLLTSAQPYSHRNVGELGGRGTAEDEHGRMIDHIEAQEEDELRALLSRHLEQARDNVLAADLALFTDAGTGAAAGRT